MYMDGFFVVRMFELLLSVVFIGILAIEAERLRKRRR